MTEGHLVSIGLLAVMVVSAGCALAVKDLLTAAALFGVFSFLTATWFALMGAPDVAFTEACVGGALTTILFVSTAFRTGRKFD